MEISFHLPPLYLIIGFILFAPKYYQVPVCLIQFQNIIDTAAQNAQILSMLSSTLFNTPKSKKTGLDAAIIFENSSTK